MRRSGYVLATVIAALALLAGATALLASVHEHLRVSRLSVHLREAEALVAAGNLEESITQYHAGLGLERDNDAARRGLALTLLSLERWSEAENYLRDLLREEPTDGVLNRALARIHAARGKEDEARRAYQRAIYGQWAAAPVDDRIATRFELIEYLRRIAEREEVVAELLTLKTELPPGQIAAARRVASLLAESGEIAPAVAVLSASLATAPRDTELLVHLATLQANAGRMIEARSTLRRASALEPRRADIAERLAILNHVLALDPTLAGLRLATRVNRARLLLAEVLEQTRACKEDYVSEVARERTNAERRMRRRAPITAETADQEIALAARLWKAAPSCQGSTAEAHAITQVLQRVESSAHPSS